jgi:arylsulfatase A-like enzyme/Tfp pilus assembly protein PilF
VKANALQRFRGRFRPWAAFLAVAFLGGLAYWAWRTLLLPGDLTMVREFQKRLAPLHGSDWNVLLVTLDTTRADHMGCYGYAPAATPTLDGLARSGIQFSYAFCQTPLTLPSHTSLFTGAYPGTHGVRDNGGFWLKPDSLTLAEVLRRSGWITSAFVSAFVLDSRWGLNQGFDVYHDNFDFSKYKTIGLDTVQRRGGETVDAFLAWLAQNGDRKFFSWIHLYDPHAPYDPPDPFKTRFPDSLDGQYDGEIAYVDSLLGTVFQSLESRGALGRTVIVITADHGESLGEHLEDTHGFFIYDATLRVPLIMKLPGKEFLGRVVDDPVELVDVLPSLLQILGLPVPSGTQGRSFLPALLGRAPRADRSVYAESFYPRYHYGWSQLRSLRSRHFKFIEAPGPELYDIVADPGETNDLSRVRPELLARFRREIQSRRELNVDDAAAQAMPARLDSETMEKLMALGYIGGPTSSARIKGQDALADPKSKIHLFNRIKRAEGDFSLEHDEEAIKELDAVIREDPYIMEARQVRAQIYLRLNKPELAEADCRLALEVDPDYESAIYVLAQAYRRQKKYAEALQGFGRLIDLNPRDAKPHLNIAEISLDRGDVDSAIDHLKKAIELDPPMSAQAHLLLGSAYLERKILDEAEREILTALGLRPRIPDAYYNLGLLYEERGDLPRAMGAYEKEIELHPGAYPAHFNMGLLLAAAGRPEEEIQHLRKAVELNPSFAKGCIFLANALQKQGQSLSEAITLAKRGLELEPESDFSPLGHFVLADIYSRLGRWDAYNDELLKGRALESRVKNRTPRRP